MVRQLAQLIDSPGFSFRRAPRPGHLRGIDFYTASNFLVALAQAAWVYQRRQGRLPNIVSPRTMTEKMFWFKFFAEMKVPESGNKLMTASFIPAALRETVRTADIVWHSPEPILPGSDKIEDGVYYLKTNHGANMFRRIEYPLRPEEKAKLEGEFGKHLAALYGFWGGEWWYNAFPRELLLERSISSRENPIAWNHYVFGRELPLIIGYRKIGGGAEAIVLNPDFSTFEWQDDRVPLLAFDMPSPAARATMREAALAIGSGFPFARIDFLLGDAEEVYLSEVTFSPGNALTPWPEEINRRLGAMWKLP